MTGWGGDDAALAVLRVAAAVNAEPAVWMDYALCAEVDADTFYPERGEPAGPAKRICRACPVRLQCLDYALANRERFGVWGGLSEHERRDLMKQRRRAA